MYTRRGMVIVYYHNGDKTLARSNKQTHNAYNHSNKVENITKA